MHFPCPRCAQPLVLDANSAGHYVDCPNCSHEFRMPTSVGAAGSLIPIWSLGVVVLLSLLLLI